MKIFKEIFGRIWALWGLISFTSTFLIIFIPSMLCYLIPGKKGQDIFIAISRVWMTFWLYIIGCPVTVTGKEHFAKNKAYIVTYNHNALLDVPISAPCIPSGNKTIAKTSFAKIPLFGWFYRKGSVLVDRNSDASRRKSFEEMKQVLQQGIHMCIYPEGTRNRTKEPLKKFYAGAFKLAVDTNTAILPAVIFNTKKAMPIHKTFFLWPCRLRLDFLTPVDSNDISAEELKDKVFKIMWDHYEAHQ
jgi:1-acyl-sn-glycerol-3-phosphate acyltransferase